MYVLCCCTSTCLHLHPCVSCLCFKDEKEEWRRFQADLQTAVVVANDIKVEAQQELRTLRRQLQEEQDRSAKLSADLEALQGVRYHLHHTPTFSVPTPPPIPTPHSYFLVSGCSSFLSEPQCGYEIPARVLPYPHPVLSFRHVVQRIILLSFQFPRNSCLRGFQNSYQGST